MSLEQMSLEQMSLGQMSFDDMSYGAAGDNGDYVTPTFSLTPMKKPV
jgi:hypothetical protein